MNDYKNYDCFTCSNWYNCGQETVMLNYKFNRDGMCHTHRKDTSIDSIEQNMRIREFEKYIEYIVNNRIPKMLW